MDPYQYQFGRGIKFASVTFLVTIVMVLWYFTKNTDCNINISIIENNLDVNGNIFLIEI